MESWSRLKRFVVQTLRPKFKSGEANEAENHVEFVQLEQDDEATGEASSSDDEALSVDEILNDIGVRRFHVKVFLILGLLNMTDSLELSMLSIVLPSIKSHWSISPLLAGVLTVSISAGMILGCWSWGWIADRFGRKPAFVGSAAFIIVFGFASAFARNYYWLWMSLFFVGFGVAITMETFVMNMELFPPKYRSAVAVLNMVFWTSGFILSSIVSLQLSAIGFRWALAIVCFPTAIFLLLTPFLPESPHYHLTAGYETKALHTLQKLAPEMDLSNTKLHVEQDVELADITHLFRRGYWKITVCACVLGLTSFMVYYSLVYTVSDIAGSGDRIRESASIEAKGSGNTLYATMALMNLPELLIIVISSVACYFVPVKKVVVAVLLLPILLQLVALCVTRFKMALLIVAMLSRSLLECLSTIFIVFISLLYPTENRSLGVGACVSAGRVGMVLGPFVFEALFRQSYFYAFVFNVGLLFLGLLATVLLPSPSGAILS